VTLRDCAVDDSSWSVQFLQGMLDRLAVSGHKYGRWADNRPRKGRPGKYDCKANLLQRWEAYEASGNTEYLIDAANFAMLEFQRPAHPRWHFTPTDASGSPGVVVAGTGHRYMVGEESPV
jgi:hypothetical protein